MNYEKRIEELGITLPESSAPKAMYIPVKQVEIYFLYPANYLVNWMEV